MRRLTPLTAFAVLPFLAAPAAASPESAVCLRVSATVAQHACAGDSVADSDPLRVTVCRFLDSQPALRSLFDLYCRGTISGYDICVAIRDEPDLDPYREELLRVCLPAYLICQIAEVLCVKPPVSGPVTLDVGIASVSVGPRGG